MVMVVLVEVVVVMVVLVEVVEVVLLLILLPPAGDDPGLARRLRAERQPSLQDRQDHWLHLRPVHWQ